MLCNGYTTSRRQGSGNSLSDVYILVLYIRHKALHYTADALREGDCYPSFKTVPLLSSLRSRELSILTATSSRQGHAFPNAG